jgi:endo-1,3(4)-beta-glucanase
MLHSTDCSALRKSTDQTEYMQLLRNHSDIYPTGKADVRFTFPVESEEEEELRLNFNWEPAHMSRLANGGDDDMTSITPILSRPEVELLMFAIPHQQERMQSTEQSSNKVHNIGCTPTLHGVACPVTGGSWSMLEHLHRASFSAPRSPRRAMVADIRQALKTDIHYALPDNYMRGAGDTYFSGKMLSKLARIIIVANEVGGVSPRDFSNAVHRLKSGVEIWLNGSAESPLLYDKTWGGIVMCGCIFDGVRCSNKYPDCPALTDQGQNFGAGFYNDHHFHFGYHIYAAAVASKFDSKWGREFHERVLLLVRDIANPSPADPYFPTWRHKDWYLGFSWASGVVTLMGTPYPNGRNEESSSEAISAYEAVALYGEVAASLYKGQVDPIGSRYYDNALRLRDMGRLLLATEIRSAKTYWHVQSPGASGVSRIYPEVYTPKVVGMLWSMLAQEQVTVKSDMA